MPRHIPVMAQELTQYLVTESARTFVDCTVGMGGHATRILEMAPRDSRLIGIDIDPESVELAREFLRPYGDRVLIIHGNFAMIDEILQEYGISEVDGIVFDLGFSSFQMDNPARGLSFMQSGPLDMRMDQSLGGPVSYDLNTKSVDELTSIIRDFGEEPWAKKIAERIVAVRRQTPLATTKQLADIVLAVVPRRRSRIHPATKTFQAFRIYKNKELANLTQGLERAVSILSSGGRICVISFHSLEDRIVKWKFRELERGCVCPPRTPVCVCGKKPVLRILTKRPVTPGAEECESNRRARSAKLRAAEKL